MLQKPNFRRRLFIHFFLVYLLFTALVIIFQFSREKNFKKRQLENTLSNITEITHNYIKRNHVYENKNFKALDSLTTILPFSGIRVTIIDASGKVLYDSEVTDILSMGNHKNRPEVQASVGESYGVSIRKSSTTNENFYYYARFYNDYFIRTAVLYNIEIVHFLQAEKLFLVFITFLFFMIWFALSFVTRRISNTIITLKDFVVRLQKGEKNIKEIDFPEDEFGVISRQIIDIYKDLNTTKDNLAVEKERLFSHLDTLKEGIAFFSGDSKKILANRHFIKFINIISCQTTISAERVFGIEEFMPVIEFVEVKKQSGEKIQADELPKKEYTIFKNGKYFNILCIVFQDHSFEIAITDATKPEKNKLVKQQMTSNIAHELKTPVTSILGYLETLLQDDIDSEKQKYFTQRAHIQAERLAELIEDIATLNKIDEAKDQFPFGLIVINEIVEEVVANLKQGPGQKNIEVSVNIGQQVVVNGSRSLLFSIFHNLADNTVKYAGENVSITISCYLEDKKYYYFSFSDDGCGIPEEHLSRIFERFYRVGTDRSRKTGGTGLGLAIVKNAVQLHHGEISARNQKGGGLEFLFTLAK